MHTNEKKTKGERKWIHVYVSCGQEVASLEFLGLSFPWYKKNTKIYIYPIIYTNIILLFIM